MSGPEPGALPAASEVATIGETRALMRATTPGPLAFTESLRLGIGGAEGTVAIAPRRLGTSLTWVGRPGADSLGDLVLREVLAEGLDVECVRDDQAPTGLMVKERRTAQSAKVWYCRTGSAGSRLAPEDIPAAKISGARLLHVTGTTPALSHTAARATQYAVDCARQPGSRASWSPATSITAPPCGPGTTPRTPSGS